MFNYRRFLALLLCITMMMATLVGCAEINEDHSDTSNTASNAQKPTESITESDTPSNTENITVNDSQSNTTVETEIETEAVVRPTIPSSEGLAFEKNSDGVSYTCTGLGTCTDTDIMIDTYNDLPVTHIAEKAFDACDTLKGVSLGYSVTSIGLCAFRNCSKLEDIYIPNSVMKIGAHAFDGTAYFEYPGNWEGNHSLYINNHFIQYIGRSASSGYALEGTVTIADMAFAKCSKMSKITLPNSIKAIGELAFSQCEKLKDITIPDSVTSIGKDAFDGCSSLTSITVGQDNKAYKSVDGNLYTKDGRILIKYAMGKTDANFVIPDSVTNIEASAFSGYKSLASITIPDSVTSIGNYAFASNTSLTSITIGKGVTSMGENVFFGCSLLTDIYFTGTEEEWNAIKGIADTNVPETATIHYNYTLN